MNTAESIDPGPGAAPTKLKRVLFVDDSPEYLATLGRVFGEWSHGEWEILLAKGSSDAFALLQEAPADLVVIDVLMPVVDGTQLLRMLHRSHPAMRKVVLTGMVDAALRNTCLKQGADLFLEKPQTPDDLIIVYRALKHVLTLEETSGFRGVLRRANIRDIIQMECLNQRCSIVQIASAEMWGEIFIERGNVVHAQTEDSKGADAFSHLVNLKSGEFNIKAFAEPTERTLSSRFEALLLAAAHAWDQMLADQEPTLHPFEPIIRHSQHHDTTTTWFRRKREDESAQAPQAVTGDATSAAPVTAGEPASAARDSSKTPTDATQAANGDPPKTAQAPSGAAANGAQEASDSAAS